MFKHILVPAAGADTDDTVFHLALLLARAFAARLVFLHIRHDMARTMFAGAAGDIAVTGDAMLDAVQHAVEVRQRQAHDAVAAFCRRATLPLDAEPPRGMPSASWVVEAGEEAHVLAAQARISDVAVLGRARDGKRVPLPLLETVLLESGHPVLLAPDRTVGSVGRRIAVAWKDTASAARAVAAALPLIATADAVTVFTIAEGYDSHAERQSGHRLCSMLRVHHPATTLNLLPPGPLSPADALLSAAEASGSDLLVMGGYSHSRMREAVFGGATRSVLRHAPLPVLMAH